MHQNRYRFVMLVVGSCAITLFTSVGLAQPPGKQVSKEEIAQLFDKWNAALQTGKAEEVVKLYAPDAILLPTVSNKVRHNHEEIKDYFVHFLENKPVGKINEQNIRTYGDVAINSGVYTFTLTKQGKPSEVRARYTFVYHRQGDRWLIVEHHSSMMPEGSKVGDIKK
jgi:uncharacterized protein (TIGR02246 family)